MYRWLRGSKGFTLVEIMIVVAIIGLLIAIALPNFVRARNTARTNLCKNNMRLLGHAAEQYNIDNNLPGTVAVTLAQAADYVKGGLTGAAFKCPAGAVAYNIGVTGDVPTITCGNGHGTYNTATGVVTP